MPKWSQQMPLVYELSSIQSLTTEDIEYIKARIEADNLFDVIFVEASGEKLIPVAYTNPEGGTPTVTVVKNGNVVKASVEPTIVKLGIIMPSALIGDDGDTFNAYLGALYSDGSYRLLVDKTTATNAFVGSTTKADGAWGDPSFTFSPSPATTATKIARGAFKEEDVVALKTIAAAETVTATKCTINGFASPVAIKVGDTTPATVDLDDADVLYEYETEPPAFFCKLTLNDDSVVELEGSGELTNAMVTNVYKDTLVSAEIGELCTSIGAAAFGACTHLLSVTISNTVTNIGDGAFAVSGITSIIIPDSVINIGNQAFVNCTSLETVTIPNSVTSIGGNAFQNCSGLTSITSNATTAPTIQNSTFVNVKAGGTLTVPSGSSGYDTWMSTDDYYLGKYNWTKVEQ